MTFRGKFVAVMLGITVVLAFSRIAEAGWCGGTSRQTVQDTNKAVSGKDRDLNSSGALRVDRDLYALHPDDVDQFGDDEAYNSLTGGRLVPIPYHRER